MANVRLAGCGRALLCLASLALVSSPAPALAGESWPGKPYSTVRGYVYDYTREASTDFLKADGSFHAGVINPEGAPLSGDQIRSIVEAVTGPAEELNPTRCYRPHHAFVFYNADGEAVGLLEICFQCEVTKSVPDKGTNRGWDLRAIKRLCAELDLLLEDSDEAYTAAWSKAKSAK